MVVKTDLELQVVELEKWLKTQQHLPQSIGSELLKRFLYSVFGDMEKAKKLIELNYAMRNKHSHIFLDRDPTEKCSQELLTVADLVPLPGVTPKKSKVLFYRLIDFDPDKFMFTDAIKMFFMMADCRFATPDESLCDGEIPVFDMAGFSLRHLRRIVFSSLRIYMKFVQEAHPVRLKQIHVLNCPSYVDKIMKVLKPFIKSEVFKLIKFHLPESTSLYEFIPQTMLPEEYGGDAGKMADLKSVWVKRLEEQREYLMDPKRWKINKINDKTKTKDESLSSIRHIDMQNLSID